MNESEIKSYIDEAIKNALNERGEPRTVNARMLTPTLHKWFEGEKKNASDSLMGKAFNGQGYTAYKVWQNLRPIVTSITGHDRITDIPLEDEELANRLAEKLCQTVYDLRMEYRKEKSNAENI